jgi:hypothetical protein
MFDGNVMIMIMECKPILKFCARTTLETTLGHFIWRGSLELGNHRWEFMDATPKSLGS